MSLSIRNQIAGTITAVHPGEVMAAVKVRLGGGQEITSAITLEAVKELALDTGTAVRVLVKSTEVALATEPVDGLSIRNRIAGTVTDVVTGGAMAGIKVDIEGAELTAAITQEAATELRLTPGSSVVALIKSTEVSLAVM